MVATSIYAGLVSLIFVALSFRVIGARRSLRVGLGDGGDPLLLRRLRAHGNFAEYVPMALILMALIEWQTNAFLIVHLMGASLIVGRLAHAYGVSAEPELPKLRVIGMALTFTAILVGALTNLTLAAFGGVSPNI